MNYDFSPLLKKVTREQRQQYKKKYGTKTPILMVVLQCVAFVAFAFVSVISITEGSSTEQGGSILTSGVVITIGFVLLIIFVQIGRHIATRRGAKILSFVEANQLGVIFNQQNINYEGIIFKKNPEAKITESIVFPGGIEIGNYIDGPRNRQRNNSKKWGYMRIKLKRKLPNMLLDARFNNFHKSKRTNLPTLMTTRNPVLSLEGNFNDYFTAYVPKGYETDALYIFTPDVLQAMVQYGTMYDMEIVDDWLYFYSEKPHKLYKADAVKQALTVINSIGTEIIDQSDYYADARVSNRTMNMVSTPGARMERKMTTFQLVITLIGSFILVCIYGFFAMSGN